MNKSIIVQRAQNGLIVAPFNGSGNVDLSTVNVFPAISSAYSVEARDFMESVIEMMGLKPTATVSEIRSGLEAISLNLRKEDVAEPVDDEPVAAEAHLVVE